MSQSLEFKILVLAVLGALPAVGWTAETKMQEPQPLNAPWPSSFDPNVDQKNDYQRRVQSYLQEVDGVLTRLSETAQRAGGETAQRAGQLKEVLLQRKQAAEARLEQLKYAPGAEWEAATKQLDSAIRDVKEVHYRAVVDMKDEKENYESRLLSQIEHLQSQIEKIKAEIRGTPAISRQKLESALDELERGRQSAVAKLQNLRNATGEAWINVKNELDRQLYEWNQNFKKVLASLREQESQTQELNQMSPPMKNP